MHPILFQIGSLTVYTYGLIMAIGFIVAYFYLLRLAKMSGQDVEFYSNMFFWLMIFGILGAKVLYLIVEYKTLASDIKDLVGCLRGGLVWYGGLIADLIFVYYYCKKHTKDYLQVADTLTSPAAVGLAIGRWGCLMAGCCYGKICNLPWAITYPKNPAFPHPMAGIPVHPSPVYESIGVFIIAFICYEAFRRSKRKGLAFDLLVLLYAPLRFGLEFLRGDAERGFVIQDKLSTSQFVGILVFIPAVLFLIYVLKNPLEMEKRERPNPQTKKGKSQGERGMKKS